MKLKLNTVYIVFFGTQHDFMGVFYTREGAQNYIDTESSMTAGERAMCFIEECEIGD